MESVELAASLPRRIHGASTKGAACPTSTGNAFPAHPARSLPLPLSLTDKKIFEQAYSASFGPAMDICYEIYEDGEQPFV